MGDREAALNCFRQAQLTIGDVNNPQGVQLGYQLYCSSVIADPTFAQGWLHVGNANASLGALHGAIGAYRRALELPDGDEPGDMTADERARCLITMGHVLQRLTRVDEAIEVINQGLAMDDDLALGWLNACLCRTALGDLDLAVGYGRRAFELDPYSPEIELGLSFALLQDGEYKEGLEKFESRFSYRLRHFLSYPFPQWHGEADMDVMLVGDQGIGDTLSFARFVEMAAKRARFLHMCVQPELVRLFSAAFQHIPNKNIIALPCPWPPARAWSTFVSLPTALGLTNDEIKDQPHIKCPNFDAADVSWKMPDRKLHIGVSWAGSPANDIDQHRSFPVEYLLELYQVPGIQLYSLQVGEKAAQAHSSGCATLLRDINPFIRDVSDTIGILKHLDLVICAESALGHICTLTDTECWMPYSFYGRDYRIGFDGSKQLWSKHLVFKQDKDAKWSRVFERITKALQRRVDRLDQREAAE